MAYNGQYQPVQTLSAIGPPDESLGDTEPCLCVITTMRLPVPKPADLAYLPCHPSTMHALLIQDEKPEVGAFRPPWNVPSGCQRPSASLPCGSSAIHFLLANRVRDPQARDCHLSSGLFFACHQFARCSEFGLCWGKYHIRETTGLPGHFQTGEFSCRG
jgi:hypothetical protein